MPPTARYRPLRRYALLAAIAVVAGGLCVRMALLSSGASGVSWIVAAALFAVTAGLLAIFATRPAIEVDEIGIRVGRRSMLWSEIAHVERVNVSGAPTLAPLLLRLTLASNKNAFIFLPAATDDCAALLRAIFRNARAAKLDGVPYAQFWGDEAPPMPRERLLLPEDEEEIERMFQRLRATGKIDDNDDVDHHGAGHHSGSDES
jgi:hypothetical protein